ncbi:MAG: hypothetical protein A3K65_06255 [Euryarchaeota archaeon RBG_16_68_12]|nr:MAG: hypothetical protein A3K65_06255 [Euryarchaeota archaeon RBG_16_68_12]
MNHDVATRILSLTSSGLLSTTDLIELTGYSPNTVVRYLGELESRGWVERRRARRISVGRPPVVSTATEAGIAELRQAEAALFRKLSGTSKVVWGPVRSFAYWGISFFGWTDLFADRRVDAPPFEVVVEANPALYEGASEGGDGRYPAIESLIAWAAKSGNPRFIGAAAVLLRDPRVDPTRLREKCVKLGTVNRVGFLAALVEARGVGSVFRPAALRETMLREGTPIDSRTAAAARRWRVDRPIPRRTIEEMIDLYGGPR